MNHSHPILFEYISQTIKNPIKILFDLEDEKC